MPSESIADPRLYMSLRALSSPSRVSTSPTFLGLGFGFPQETLRDVEKILRIPPLPTIPLRAHMQGSGSAVQRHSLKPSHLSRTASAIWAVGNTSDSPCVAGRTFFLLGRDDSSIDLRKQCAEVVQDVGGDYPW